MGKQFVSWNYYFCCHKAVPFFTAIIFWFQNWGLLLLFVYLFVCLFAAICLFIFVTNWPTSETDAPNKGRKKWSFVVWQKCNLGFALLRPREQQKIITHQISWIIKWKRIGRMSFSDFPLKKADITVVSDGSWQIGHGSFCHYQVLFDKRLPAPFSIPQGQLVHDLHWRKIPLLW